VSTGYDVEVIRERVAAYRPVATRDDARVWAATALVVGGPGTEPHVAFIQRPTRDGDRWSGQMALPGGKRDPADETAVATAVRETREEVGLVLPPPAGRLDDVRGRLYAGVVATYVFVLDERPELRPAPGEVAAAVWIPVSTLLSVEAAVRYRWLGLNVFPGIRFGEHVIWGLTHRILGSFASSLGVDLPSPIGHAG
jgi:8-oxo-dGTP pyrophosphatase MutT (NUDIX family)